MEHVLNVVIKSLKLSFLPTIVDREVGVEREMISIGSHFVINAIS